MWGWILLFLLIGVLSYYLYTKMKGGCPDSTGGPCGNEDAAPLVGPPGKGNPLFTGVRVVELCEVVATPVCGRMFADLGADVIKVERPGRGDLCRTLLSKEFEPDRPFGSPFDACNTSKRSLILDIKKTSDYLKMKELLKGADIFITNTRYPALQKLGLTYEQIREEFPGLIYAHLSAFGTTGPCAAEPGFDTSSFWVATGLSNSIHREGMYSFYPAGFGDAVAGSILFSGICSALRSKFETGIGMKVDTSLFNTGLFCQAATLCKAPAPERPVPKYENITARVTPLCGSYQCKNYRFLHIAPPVSEKAAAVEKLAKVIPDVQGKSGAELYDAIANKLKDMDVEAAAKLVKDAGVDCVMHDHNNLFPLIVTREEERYQKSQSFLKSFATDVPVIPNLPFDCHCSDKHAPRSRAPYHGQHTEQIQEKGWYPRDEKAVLKTTKDSSAQVEKKPLEGVTIVEWSEDSVAASTATMFAVDLGATVLKVEPEGGAIWRKENPEFFETMNRGKKSVVTDDVESLLGDAQIFVTNRPMSELKAKGLDPTSLAEKFPNLIYGLVTPRGKDGPEDIRSDYLIWFGECGLGNLMEPAPPGCPSQLGSLMTGTHLWAGLSAALFHKDRTGEGQLVETNHHRSAVFGCVFLSAFYLRNQGFQDFASTDPREIDEARYYLALASFQCYKTKDGIWINLIGPDIVRDVKKLIDVLGVWPQIIKGVFPFIKNFAMAKGSLFKKLRQLGFYLIPIFENKIAEYTYDEISQIFTKGSVWFCKVGVSDQMAHHPQVKFLDLLQEAEKGNRILRLPVNVGGLQENAMSAPTL